MYSDNTFYPGILSSEDLKLLQETVRDLVQGAAILEPPREPERVAKIVLRLYRLGLTEPAKLHTLSALMADQQPTDEVPTSK